MGIRQLQTFMQKKVPNGYIDVSLYDACEEFKRQNDNIRPTLLIDLHHFLRTLIKDYKELLCGIRHNKVQENLEKFLNELSQIADLIFYNDGLLSDVKLMRWMQRQDQRCEASKKLLDKIYKIHPLEVIIKSVKDMTFPISHLEIVEELARKYGTLKTAMDRECDAEMAQFACRNSRVLAILNGNDVITFDDTCRFHKSLRIKNRFDPSARFQALARYIRNKQLSQSEYIDAIVAVTIFKKCTPEDVEKVRNSLAFYDINFESRKIEDATQRFCLEKSYTFVYSVLNSLSIKFVFHYFDQMRSDSFYGHINNLFSKQIGVILKDKPVQKYKIVSKMSHLDPKYELLEVDPIIPKIPHPPLIELLNRQQHPEHDKTRFDLLKWLISEEKLRNVDLMAIPKNIFHYILTLTYMVVEGFIDVVEADIILLSIKHVEGKTVPENLTTPQAMRPRAFFTSYLFSYCFFNIQNCLEVTGLKDLVNLNNFDGVLFHDLYSKHEKKSSKVVDFLGDLNEYRHYEKL